MSKLLLVLCLIIGTYTANASVVDSVKDQIKAIREKVSELVQTAIDNVRKALEKAKENLAQWEKQAREKIEELTKKVSETVNDALKQLEDKIDEWLEEAKKGGVDASECRKIASEVRNTAVSIVVNSTRCMSNRLEEGAFYIEDINRIADEIYANLTAINEEGSECFENIDGFQDAAAALSCITTALGKATDAITVQVPDALNDIIHLGLVVGDVIPGMAYCVSRTAVSTIKSDMEVIKNQVKSCIDSKVSQEAVPSAAFY